MDKNNKKKEYAKMIQSSIEFLQAQLANNKESSSNDEDDDDNDENNKKTNNEKSSSSSSSSSKKLIKPIIEPKSNILSICKDIIALKKSSPTNISDEKAECKDDNSTKKMIKLVPLANLLSPTKLNNQPKALPSTSSAFAKMQTIVLDSDDDSLDDSVKSSTSLNSKSTKNSEKNSLYRDKKLLSSVKVKLPTCSDLSFSSSINSSKKGIVIDDDDEDDDIPISNVVNKTNKRSITNNDVSKKRRLLVKLKKLPRNMDQLMKKHNLTQILNEKQKVIATASKISTTTPATKRLLCATSGRIVSDDDSNDVITENSPLQNEKSTKSDDNMVDNDDNSSKISNNRKKKNATIDLDSDSTSNEKNNSTKDKKVTKLTNGKNSKSSTSGKNVITSSDDDDDDDDDIVRKPRRLAARASTSKKKSIKMSDSEASEHESSDASKTKGDQDSDFKANEASEDSEDMKISKKRKAHKSNKNSSSNSEESDSDKKSKQKRKRRRIKHESGSSSDDDDDKDGKGNKGRRNIRKVIKEKDLEDETKRAAREESERKKRIEDRQKLYNELYESKSEEVKELDKLILDFDEKTKEPLISVDRKLVKKLKPHQGSGVKFMWDTCFETIHRAQKNKLGSGCILAHCMGLGKTLQVVTLVHTLLSHNEDTSVEKVLVICPLSTVLNWVNEFKMWLRQCADNKDIEIFEISKYKQNYERVYQINCWHEEGGVLILGYDMFRNLTSDSKRLKKKERDTIQKCLVDPGADLVVCDEGHLLKNSKTSLSKAVNRIRTLRRIVLTGTPLQNNLNEYYCMVQFVKPNLLGKYNEYLNRFVNPITNGQYVDSTERDIQMMKKRSHILHKMLDGCVQRRDYAVLAPYLPVKHEYVVSVQLTELQVKLYKYYLEHKPAADPGNKLRSSVLFSDFQNLQRIWTHPRVMRYNSDKFEVNAQKKRDAMSDSEGSLKDFVVDDEESTSEDSNSSAESVASDDSRNLVKKSNAAKAAAAAAKKQAAVRRTRGNTDKFEEALEEPKTDLPDTKGENPTEWWMQLVPENELDDLRHSGKLMLLFSLLEECEQIGDKLLVFSQSLYSLDVIEHFLAKIDEQTQKQKKKKRDKKDDDDDADDADEEVDEEAKLLGNYTGSWSIGADYFRLDGSTSIENRNAACVQFNKESNTRARLFLISTRAGGLGINLVAANRVVIFDVSWNPSHDIQSIFRVYRFGQKKPCYIYRFIAHGTMEEKIYERQVTKLAISKRVIDEHQIDRHYKENDLMALYQTDLEPAEPRPIPLLPKDRLFAGQLKKFDKIIYKYHEHDSLLENKQEETLNEEEIKAAWEEFEAEKVRPVFQYNPQPRTSGMGPVTSNQIFGFRTDVLLKLLNLLARKTYPTADEMQVNRLVPLLLQQLYEQMQKADTTMYASLIALQRELEGPAMGYGQLINPYAYMINNSNYRNNQQFQQPTQHQQMIAAAQNRLIFDQPRPSASMPSPTTIIELDD